MQKKPTLSEIKMLYRDTFHAEMFQFLALHTNELVDDKFRGKIGLSSRMIRGPKGSGKSTCLKTFMDIVPLVHPNLIPLYYDFPPLARTADANFPDLLQCLIKEVKVARPDFGFEVDAGDCGTPTARFQESLE